MDKVFIILAKVQYFIEYGVTALFNRASLVYVSENQMFRIYSSIPARMEVPEIVFIVFFGMFSALIASWLAGRKILKLTVTEVLHDE